MLEISLKHIRRSIVEASICSMMNVSYDALCESSSWRVLCTSDGQFACSVEDGYPIFFSDLTYEQQLILAMFFNDGVRILPGTCVGYFDLDNLWYDRCILCEKVLKKQFYLASDGGYFCSGCANYNESHVRGYKYIL